MNAKSFFKTQLIAILCAGLILPQTVLAMPPLLPGAASPIGDVALGPGGTLAGQVVDAQGIGIPGAAVSLFQRDAEVARTVTDQGGYFQVAGLRGGSYQVVSADGSAVFRLWNAGMAPPAARPGALVVSGAPALRGQGIGWGRWVLPALLAGGVAAGVAVAVSQDHHHAAPASP